MFNHILTTDSIEKESSIKKIMESWSVKFGFNVEEYNIRLFNFTNILNWVKNDEKFYCDNLSFLLEQGRASKQLVIIHLDNFNDLDKIKGTVLYDRINCNCDYITSQNVLDYTLERFNKENLILIEGGVASGKTTFVKQILNDYFIEKNIVIVEPSYAPLSSLIGKNLENVNAIDYTEMNIDSILSYSPDLVVFEEALYMPNITFLHTLFEKGIKVIIIKQVISDSEMFFIAQQYKKIGDYMAITADQTNPFNIGEVEEIRIEMNVVTKSILYKL